SRLLPWAASMKWRFWQQRKTAPPRRPVVRVHETVLAATIRGLQSFGDANGPHEGIVYWAGREQPQEWIITTVIIPEAVTTYASVRRSAVQHERIPHGCRHLLRVTR